MVRNGTEWYRAKSRILANVNTLIVSVDTLNVITQKKRVGFLRLFSLNTVLLIRKEALNNDSERYYVQVDCTPPINTFQEHLFSSCEVFLFFSEHKARFIFIYFNRIRTYTFLFSYFCFRFGPRFFGFTSEPPALYHRGCPSLPFPAYTIV